MLIFGMLSILFVVIMCVATLDYFKFNKCVYLFEDHINAQPRIVYEYDLALLNKILGDGEGEND